MTKSKNKTAVALGRKGGLVQPIEFKRLGGKLRWLNTTPQERSAEMKRVRAARLANVAGEPCGPLSPPVGSLPKKD